ncbi:uncharacterized protein LOC144904892 [Branchiostoma floridae x Branchiostoma belcheri]
MIWSASAPNHLYRSVRMRRGDSTTAPVARLQRSSASCARAVGKTNTSASTANVSHHPSCVTGRTTARTGATRRSATATAERAWCTAGMITRPSVVSHVCSGTRH